MEEYFGKLLDLIWDMLAAFCPSLQLAPEAAAAATPAANSITHRPRKRRSIVRVIGTYLPLPSAPRVHLNLAAWNSSAHNNTSNVNFQNQYSKVDEVETSNEGSSQGDSSDYLSAIKSLKDELQELRLKVSAILENQSNAVKEVVRDIGVLTDSEDEAKPRDKSVPPPPPPMPPTPPPPPPPPLPPGATTPINRLQIMKKTESRYNGFSTTTTTTTPSAIHILGQVLSEMKNGRPKLRPVQRSPGGRPLKPIRAPKTDPSDVLTEVLKRRFSIAQTSSDTNESDSSAHTEITSSPDWNSYTS